MTGLPASVGAWRVLRPLGKGGTAHVFETVCPVTGQPRALKLQRAPGAARAGARFLREYEILATLDHPGLPRVHERGVTDEGAHYLVLERLDGRSGRPWARTMGPPGAPWRVAQVLRVLATVASLLEYLHERGLVHGDVKPSNLVVAPGGEVHLMDLGGARSAAAGGPWRAEGRFFGTAAYAAPENLRNGRGGPAADLYSLAVCAWRLIADQNPFEGPDRAACEHLHRTVVAPPLDALVPAVPRAVAALVTALLAKKPGARPQAEAAHRVLRAAAGEVRPLPPVPPDHDPAAIERVRAFLRDIPPGGLLALGGHPADTAAALRQAGDDAAALGHDVRRRDRETPAAIATVTTHPLVVLAPALVDLSRPTLERLFGALREAATTGCPAVVVGIHGEGRRLPGASGIAITQVRVGAQKCSS